MEEQLPSLPFRVEIEVINRCNLGCDYCYVTPFFDGYATPQETLKYIISKTEEQIKPFDVIFLGGEPFLRPDMVDIMDYAKRTFSTDKVSISTNGTVFKGMSKEKMKRLRELTTTPFIQVSIDSTRNPNIEKSLDTFEGIKLLQGMEIPFRVGIVLTQRNYEDFHLTLNDLLQLSLLTSINLEPLQRTTDSHFEANRLSDQQVSSITATVRELVKKNHREDVYINGFSDETNVDLNTRILMRKENPFELKDRRITNAGVCANGDVSLDGVMMRHQKVGNILRQDWKEIWAEAGRMYKEQQRQSRSRLKVLQ